MTVKTTILVVDEEGTSLSVKEGLESYDSAYVVDKVEDGPQCLEYVKEMVPDLILLSITLNDMGGFALREKLKTTAAKDVPVIYLVAKYDFDLTKKVGMFSADDFITKPINMPELLLRIQKIMVWRCYRKRNTQNRDMEMHQPLIMPKNDSLIRRQK
jgi:DNA-binding response OmpR family regulator